MINTILFDLAEVYLQGMIGIESKIAKVLNVNETDVISVQLAGPKRDLLFCGKISEDEFWRRAIEENRYPTKVEGYESTLHFLRSTIRDNFKEIPGTKEVITSLKGAGYKLGLLSDHAREWIDYCEANFPLKELFDVICYSFQIGLTKQSPETFVHALNKLNADPSTTLFIDNNPANLDVARSAHIKYVYQFVDAISLKSGLQDYKITL